MCYFISYKSDTIYIAELICDLHERFLHLKHFYNALKKVHVNAEYIPASITFEEMSDALTGPGENSSAPEGSQGFGAQAEVDDQEVKLFKLQAAIASCSTVIHHSSKLHTREGWYCSRKQLLARLCIHNLQCSWDTHCFSRNLPT